MNSSRTAVGDSPNSPIGVVRSLLGITIPITALSFFFEAMYAQLNGGRSIADFMLHEAKYGPDLELRHICSVIAPKLRNGARLIDCLAPYCHRFPELAVAVMEVGEVSGGLADSAKRLADTFNQTRAFERNFKLKAFDKRLYLLILCLIYMISLTVQAMTGLNTDRTFMDVAPSIAVHVAVFAITMPILYIVGRTLLRHLYRWNPLRLVVDTILLALPGIGLIFRNLAAARWARSFAVLWSAGINISTALEVSSRSALNSHYERAMLIAATQTRIGWPLSKTLSSTQLLPPILLQIIVTCEQIGRLDDQLLKMAAQMESDATERAIQEMNRLVIAGQIVLAVAAFAYSA